MKTQERTAVTKPAVVENFEIVLQKRSSRFIGVELHEAFYLHCGFVEHDIENFRRAHEDLRKLVRHLLDREVYLQLCVDNPDSYMHEIKCNGVPLAFVVRDILWLAANYKDEIEAYFAYFDKFKELSACMNVARKYGYKLVKIGA